MWIGNDNFQRVRVSATNARHVSEGIVNDIVKRRELSYTNRFGIIIFTFTLRHSDVCIRSMHFNRKRFFQFSFSGQTSKDVFLLRFVFSPHLNWIVCYDIYQSSDHTFDASQTFRRTDCIDAIDVFAIMLHKLYERESSAIKIVCLKQKTNKYVIFFLFTFFCCCFWGEIFFILRPRENPHWFNTTYWHEAHEMRVGSLKTQQEETIDKWLNNDRVDAEPIDVSSKEDSERRTKSKKATIFKLVRSNLTLVCSSWLICLLHFDFVRRVNLFVFFRLLCVLFRRFCFVFTICARLFSRILHMLSTLLFILLLFVLVYFLFHFIRFVLDRRLVFSFSSHFATFGLVTNRNWIEKNEKCARAHTWSHFRSENQNWLHVKHWILCVNFFSFSLFFQSLRFWFRRAPHHFDLGSRINYARCMRTLIFFYICVLYVNCYVHILYEFNANRSSLVSLFSTQFKVEEYFFNSY